MANQVPLSLREAFFDKAHETFVIFDKGLHFIDVNEAFLRSLHVSREQIIGKHIGDLSPGIEKTERYATYQEVLKTGVPTIIDETRTHPSLGNNVSRIYVFKLGEGLGMAILNVTDLKEAVDELERFIYKISHDLRGPIARIRGIANLAYLERDLEVRQTYVTMVQEQTVQLDGLLERLVEASRIREGDRIILPINFTEIVEEVKKLATQMNNLNPIKFDQEISIARKFYSDKILITSILENLIDNSLKYRNPEVAEAFIKISITEQDKGAKIIISDNGIGIDDHLQPDVFKVFFRGTNSVSGAGLGLYTVNQAVKKLKGIISLESKRMEGTTVSIFVPNERFELENT